MRSAASGQHGDEAPRAEPQRAWRVSAPGPSPDHDGEPAAVTLPVTGQGATRDPQQNISEKIMTSFLTNEQHDCHDFPTLRLFLL